MEAPLVETPSGLGRGNAAKELVGSRKVRSGVRRVDPGPGVEWNGHARVVWETDGRWVRLNG